MKKIVLHIGTEKTATKSLQQFFCLNRHHLEELGIWYPNSEKLQYCCGNAHFPLAASLITHCPEFIPENKHFKPDDLFFLLTKDFMRRDEKTALLSAEHFSSRCSQMEQIEKMGHYLKGFQIEIVVYFRPQHELLASAYSTYLMAGGKESLQKIVKEKCLVPGISYFNYLLMMEPWLKVFGKESITVRIFQKGRLKNGNIFDDMLFVLKIPDKSSFHRPQRLNQSISREAAEFIWLANQYFTEFDEGPRSEWERGQTFRMEVLPRLSNQYPLHQLLSAGMREELKRFYEKDNREVALQLRSDLKGVLFSDEKDGAGPPKKEFANSFSPELVKWVVGQWKKAHPITRV